MATKKKNEVVAAEEEVEVVPEWLQKMRIGEGPDYMGSSATKIAGSDVGSAGTMGTTTTEGDGKSEWEKYKEQYLADQEAQYTQYGKRAMQDTVGELSARTGGLASSYAGIVGQETYDNYMQELSAKYPDLVAAALEMYNLENPKASTGSSNWTYGIASNNTDKKEEKKAAAKKAAGGTGKEDDETYSNGGYTEEEIWALRGLNPDYVAQNTTARERDLLYNDSLFRVLNPMYSSVIDPYYATGKVVTPSTKTGTATDLPTMAQYMSPESLAIYLAELERLNKTSKK